MYTMIRGPFDLFEQFGPIDFGFSDGFFGVLRDLDRKYAGESYGWRMFDAWLKPKRRTLFACLSHNGTALFAQLLRNADSWSCLRRSTTFEYKIGISEPAGGVLEKTWSAENQPQSVALDLVDLVEEALTRRLRAYVFTTAAAFLRWVRRTARMLLRRIFGTQRHRHEEQPDALSHQHIINQYRIRGPNACPEDEIQVLSVFRELVTV